VISDGGIRIADLKRRAAYDPPFRWGVVKAILVGFRVEVSRKGAKKGKAEGAKKTNDLSGG
jgi:hypothetical protein